MKTLLYLESRIVINHIKLILRSPKRLVPALLSLGCLLFVFGGAGGRHDRTCHVALAELRPYMEYIWPTVFGLSVIISAISLTAAFSQSLIAFRQTEVDFLIPSGLDRRLVMGSKLLKLILKSLGLPVFVTIVWMSSMQTVFASGESAAAWPAYLAFLMYAAFFLSLYTLVNLIGAYRSGGRWWVSLVVRSLSLSTMLFPVALALAGWLLAGNAVAYLLPAFRHPVTTTLLFPAKWLTDLLLSPITGWNATASIELLGLAALGVVTFGLVVNRRENPYEPSLVSPVGMAALVAASRTGDWTAYAKMIRDAEIRKINPARTSVPPFGRGAWALVWKSAVFFRRRHLSAYACMLVVLGLLVAAPKIVMTAVGESAVSIPSWGVSLPFLLLIILFGSMISMAEMRKDLKQADLVKPMPIAAWQMMVIETAYAVALVTAAAWAVMIESAALDAVQGGGLLFLMAVVTPFVVGATTCAQLPVSVIYPDMDEPASQSIGGFLAFVLAAAVMGGSALIGAVPWNVGLWRPAVALAVIVFTLAISVAGVAVGSLLYARYDPTDE